MELLEKDLEKIIMTSSPEELRKRGLWIGHQKMTSQFKIGNYGRADIIGYDIYKDPNGYERSITLYELKKDVLSVSAFFQAVRYVKGLQRLFETIGRSNLSIEFKIVLIGKKPQDYHADWIYLPDVFCHNQMSVEIYSYDYDIRGVYFKEECGYRLIEEGWK